jgi:DUF218 domain
MIFRGSISYHILVFLMMAYLHTGCIALMHSNKKTLRKSLENQPFDAIIVPGSPYNPADTAWNATHERRVSWAVYLYQKGYTKNIIFSGAAVYTPYVESEILGLYAEKLGVPKAHIFAEKKAEHSTENTYYSYRMAKDMGFQKIGLASDAFQVNTLRSFIHKFDLPIELLPVVSKVYKEEIKGNYFPKISTDSLAKPHNFVPLPERETLRERLRGTFGSNIIWHREDLKKQRLLKKYEGRIVD